MKTKYYYSPNLVRLDDGKLNQEGWIYTKKSNSNYQIRSLMYSEVINSYRTRKDLIKDCGAGHFDGSKIVEEGYDCDEQPECSLEISEGKVKRLEKTWQKQAKELWPEKNE